MKNKKQDRGDVICMNGTVEEALPGTLFKVTLSGGAASVLCTLSGRLRLNHIRVLPGDNVQIEVSPYDMTKGRITFRS
jgi:translation initiation factor IF-1